MSQGITDFINWLRICDEQAEGAEQVITNLPEASYYRFIRTMQERLDDKTLSKYESVLYLKANLMSRDCSKMTLNRRVSIGKLFLFVSLEDPGQGAFTCHEQSIRPEVVLNDLPEGKNTYKISAKDYSGQSTDDGGKSITWSSYIDRTAPTITAAGELKEKDNTWVNPLGDTTIELKGEDARSGVASYMLDAFDGQGDNVLHDVTNARATPGPIDQPCPVKSNEKVTVDMGDLPSGPVRFEASSMDFAGNVSVPVEWSVFVDRRSPVGRVSGEHKTADGVAWFGGKKTATIAFRHTDTFHSHFVTGDYARARQLGPGEKVLVGDVILVAYDATDNPYYDHNTIVTKITGKGDGKRFISYHTDDQRNLKWSEFKDWTDDEQGKGKWHHVVVRPIYSGVNIR